MLAPAGPAAVVLYRPGCPFAIRLRVALVLHWIPYVARRLVGGEGAVSPTVLVGERRLTNPSWRAVAAACREG